MHVITHDMAQVVIPKQVYDEWMRHNNIQEQKHENDLENKVSGFYDILNYLDEGLEKSNINSMLDRLKKYQRRMYRYRYGKRNEKLQALLIDRQKGLLIDEGKLTNSLVVEFALGKTPPFFSNELNNAKSKIKTEAADAVIFFTVYENLLSEEIKAEKKYFVTNNFKDYSAPNNPAIIHENLKVYADEVGIVFSNNLDNILNEILGKFVNCVIEFSTDTESLKEYIKDKYFEECPECGGEVHVNADSYHGPEPKVYEKTFWLKCKCGYEWSTGDLITDNF